MKPLTPPETVDQKAVRLLKRQLDEINSIRPLNYHHPVWKAWRDTTMTVLQKYVGPSSQYLDTYRNLRFFGPPRMTLDLWGGGGGRLPADHVSHEDAVAYQKACDMSEVTLWAAIQHVDDFGVYVEEETPARRPGKKHGGTIQSGVHFHDQVSIAGNQVFATDNATQSIGQMGDVTGASLREIGELFGRSLELKGREILEGQAAIEGLTIEVRKPEAKRNWKSILEYGEKILTIISKATDIADKLAPYAPAIGVLMENAMRR